MRMVKRQSEINAAGEVIRMLIVTGIIRAEAIGQAANVSKAITKDSSAAVERKVAGRRTSAR